MLERIHGHEDLLSLNEEQREQLCAEIREFLIDRVSKTGGHLASNLGMVELSVALETVYDTSKDRLVFDVGHQSYVHKMLTGRQADFDRLRQFGGIAGFPKPSESETDSFVAGHASSSVSIALGMARARTLLGQDYDIVAVIGDGAATGGMAYEGLNDLAESREPMVIVLNDNEMSIDRNVGGMARHLSRIRTKDTYLGMKQRYRNFMSKTKFTAFIYRTTRAVKDWFKRMLLPITLFENMGLTYIGPVDGNDLPNLTHLLRLAREMKRPVVVHVLTKKGKGYSFAEENPSKFHGIGKFDPKTGETRSKGGESFSDSFGKTMMELAEKDNRICAITAAMPGGTGLLEFKKSYPKRTFDVGIAEEHAVSMAGGLAKQGMVPVVALYSTFLQRSYDMILQDIAMLNLHVVLAVDRAGLVGEDGETHHGIYDIGFLRHAPGMTILCPASIAEQKDMLKWAVEKCDGPVAVRYPRGGDREFTGNHWADDGDIKDSGLLACHRTGDDVTLITYGTMLDNTMKAAELLSQLGIEATVLRLLTVNPLPVSSILKMMSKTHHVVMVEEAAGGCGIREALAWELEHLRPGIRIDGIDLGHRFITHGDLKSLYRYYGLDDQFIADYVQEVCSHEN
ncbi:MAG: 1-deoxy-D-xylulose-5-phosphate synthase [Oscillospiraceae bacterium]|nr:1-deoxy-D-xylulose-5-phosphate synthase [Oscillospiraceae bacterium]